MHDYVRMKYFSMTIYTLLALNDQTIDGDKLNESVHCFNFNSSYRVYLERNSKVL